MIKHKYKGGSIMKKEQQNNNKVDVIWTDPSTQITYNSQVDFETKLDFDKMHNVVLSM